MTECMFNYMTDITTIDINPLQTIEFTVQGHDLHALLYAYMDEILFRFSTDNYCIKKSEIIEFTRNPYSITIKA